MCDLSWGFGTTQRRVVRSTTEQGAVATWPFREGQLKVVRTWHCWDDHDQSNNYKRKLNLPNRPGRYRSLFCNLAPPKLAISSKYFAQATIPPDACCQV